MPVSHCAVTSDTTQIKSMKAYNAIKIPTVVYLELAMAVVFAALFVWGLGTQAMMFAGIYLFYAIGFGVVSVLSLREARLG